MSWIDDIKTAVHGDAVKELVPSADYTLPVYGESKQEEQKPIQIFPHKKADVYNTILKTFVASFPKSHREIDKLRVSGLYMVCPREFVLNYWNPQPSRTYDLASEFKMGLGTELHWLMQNRILGPLGLLYGKWKKKDESNIVRVGFHPDSELAIDEYVKQQKPTWIFIEPEYYNELYRLIGHCDGMISRNKLNWLTSNIRLLKTDLKIALKEIETIGIGKLGLLEMKLNGDRVWSDWNTYADTPPYYRMQANVYQWLDTDLDDVTFLLCNRETLEIKTIVSQYELHWIEQAKTKMRIIWEAIRDEKLPEVFMACKTSADKRAMECAHSRQCWQKGLDFNNWIQECKKSQPDRQFLDLSKNIYQ